MKGECLVKEIQMKNFRSLKDTGMQKLSPITILVGENSSGKSTFLRAFPLLKQSISKRTSGPILWAGDVDDYVDFGSFEETVTNDESDKVIFAFGFDLRTETSIPRYYIFDEDTDDVNVVDQIKPDYEKTKVHYELTIASSDGKDRVSSLSLSINSANVIFNFDKDDVTMQTVDYFWYFSNQSSSENKLNQNRHYGRFQVSSKVFGFRIPNVDYLWDRVKASFGKTQNEGMDIYNLRQLIVPIGLKLTTGKKLSYIGESKKYPSSYIDLYNKFVLMLENDSDGHLKEIIQLLAIYSIFPLIDDYIFTYFKQVHYIAPLRATAERYYRLRNLAIDEVDYQGKNLPIFINSLSTQQLKKFQAWTDEHFGFSVITDKSKGHLSLQIKLRDSDKQINLSDTGFGYSQVLPIITQLWELSTRKRTTATGYADRNQRVPLVIAIEQPELHLHPAIQAKLAKAFIACIDLARKNRNELQLIIETHSETIVNYFGRAIARGQLKKDDVSLILFDKNIGDSYTTVHNSFYDNDGYLNDWPYGFFGSED